MRHYQMEKVSLFHTHTKLDLKPVNLIDADYIMIV